MFSSEYCEIFKNTYFEEHLLTTDSDFSKQYRTAVSSYFCIDSFLTSDNLLTGYEQLSY